jgi:hypothetical protein
MPAGLELNSTPGRIVGPMAPGRGHLNPARRWRAFQRQITGNHNENIDCVS